MNKRWVSLSNLCDLDLTMSQNQWLSSGLSINVEWLPGSRGKSLHSSETGVKLLKIQVYSIRG